MIVPRELISFSTTDVSALAKSLRNQLAAKSTLPSHVEMLNMLARAAGHRNFQQLRAKKPADVGSHGGGSLTLPDKRRDSVLRADGYFDAQGRLKSWPARTSIQNLCLWVIWSKIPSKRVFSESEISKLINERHLFGDPAIIRRTLFALGLVARTADGREYRRIEREPTPEAAALIRVLRERTSTSHAA